MRDAFASELTTLAEQNDKIVFLSGDIGNRLFDNYKKKFPERFLNCGVAEANMISTAAGMALSGLRPIVYTINSFITYRAYEQLRLDLCYHNQPVIVVGVGAGLGYSSLGTTHHSCEDIGIMRILPNMKVVCPADPVEVRLALREAVKENGPVYLRLGKKGEPVIHSQSPEFKIGKAIVVRPGTDVCLLSTGTIIPSVLKVAEGLESEGIKTQVVSFHTVKPLDKEFLSKCFSNFSVVATIEEHSLIGGLGGGVAEWLTEQTPQKARLIRFGTNDKFLHEAAEQEYAHEYYHLTPQHMMEKLKVAYSQALSSPKSLIGDPESWIPAKSMRE